MNCSLALLNSPTSSAGVRNSAAMVSMINGKSFLRHLARTSSDCTPTLKLISAPTFSNFSEMANLSSDLVPRSSIIPDRVGIAMLPEPTMASPAGNTPMMMTTSLTLLR